MKKMQILLVIIIVFGFVFWLNWMGKRMTKNQGGTQYFTNKTSGTPSPTYVFKWPWQGQNTRNNNQDTNKNQNSQNNPQQQSVNDSGPVGSMNHVYLQGTMFKRMIVEIDYVQEKAPDPTTQNEILNDLQRFADKPDGITLAGGNAINSTKQDYTSDDLYGLMRANRVNYSKGDTATLYVLYVNGSYAQNSNVLGLALDSSFIVIFKDRIQDATTALVYAPQIERAVAVHELGHVLGLVNLNYRSSIDHEDSSHPGHSSSTGSVMYWAVEDISVANILHGGPPYQYDPADQDDLSKIRSGAY